MPLDPQPYELESAKRLGVSHAVAFPFARHALATAVQLLGVRPGDEVLMSALTCKVIPLALQWIDVRPIYVDVSRDTLNMDAADLERKLTPRTRCVLFQHTYGSPLGLGPIVELTTRRQLPLIEDCAQCMPMKTAEYSPGTAGWCAVFSNNVLKPLPAGSGGLAVTNDAELATRLRERQAGLPAPAVSRLSADRLGDWARRWVGPRTYWPALTLFRSATGSGSTASISEEIAHQVGRLAVQPTVAQMRNGLAWLANLNAIADHRRNCCLDYEEGLKNERDAVRPSIPKDVPLLYFPILSRKKARILTLARRRLLQVVDWPGPTPIYSVDRSDQLRKYGYEPGSCPTAESVAGELIGLPTETSVKPQHRRALVSLVREAVQA